MPGAPLDRGRRPHVPISARDRAGGPGRVPLDRAGRGGARRRTVRVRKEHAAAGDQRARAARVLRRADRARSGSTDARRPSCGCARSARSSGTLLQDPAKQIVGATVESELAFGPENLGDRARRRSAARIRGGDRRDAASRHLAGRETAYLSGGERQLLAMAGALMLRPRCYVVDEPLANLDPATARSPARPAPRPRRCGTCRRHRRAPGRGGTRSCVRTGCWRWTTDVRRTSDR